MDNYYKKYLEYKEKIEEFSELMKINLNDKYENSDFLSFDEKKEKLKKYPKLFYSDYFYRIFIKPVSKYSEEEFLIEFENFKVEYKKYFEKEFESDFKSFKRKIKKSKDFTFYWRKKGCVLF